MAAQAQGPAFDPGLTRQYTGVLTRAINKDGLFNVRKLGITWRDSHPYLYLINASWAKFITILFAAYLILNLLFAGLYAAIGLGHLKGAEASTHGVRFLNAFFFSAHTLTTVGYGNIYPDGVLTNAVAVIEAFFGLMIFAIATGLLFGRFSKPSARISFSENAIVAPYNGGSSLQFRIVNRRTNNLIELEARMILMTVENISGRRQRQYSTLDLERSSVMFFPLSWTIVHPITSTSPLYGKTAEELAFLQAEILVNVKGWDETFGQTVHSRYSYRYDEVVWNAKFTPAFEIDENGDMQLLVHKVGEFEL
ncbi:MAG: hypothetical protein JO091_03240, partial [Acidobacteriaceae bacterium]|nr:hypothetical protein [Acidobacteriaceae bacterium]